MLLSEPKYESFLCSIYCGNILCFHSVHGSLTCVMALVCFSKMGMYWQQIITLGIGTKKLRIPKDLIEPIYLDFTLKSNISHVFMSCHDFVLWAVGYVTWWEARRLLHWPKHLTSWPSVQINPQSAFISHLESLKESAKSNILTSGFIAFSDFRMKKARHWNLPDMHVVGSSEKASHIVQCSCIWLDVYLCLGPGLLLAANVLIPGLAVYCG